MICSRNGLEYKYDFMAKKFRIAFDFLNHAKETMEKLYPGYDLRQCRINYSDVVDGVYIRCILRKRRAGSRSEEKRRRTDEQKIL